MWKKYLFLFWSWNLSQKEQKKAAAEKKAALAAMLQTQEVSQKAKETVTSVSPSESGQQHSKRKLPVGASVSSVNVDYEYFEVGTGQVRLRQLKQTVWNNAILLLGFYVFFHSFSADDFGLCPLIVVHMLCLWKALPFGESECWESASDYWKTLLNEDINTINLFAFTNEWVIRSVLFHNQNGENAVVLNGLN